jgi:hypothetical protein
MMGDSPGRLFAYRINLDHAGYFDVTMTGNGMARGGWPDKAFKVFSSDAILLADANRLQSAAANIAAHRSHMKPEAFSDLLQRIHRGVHG